MDLSHQWPGRRKNLARLPRWRMRNDKRGPIGLRMIVPQEAGKTESLPGLQAGQLIRLSQSLYHLGESSRSSMLERRNAAAVRQRAVGPG